MKITIYNEFVHEREEESIKAVYPAGIHVVLKELFEKELNATVRCFCVDDVNQGLTDQVLADTDVLVWWGHMAHEKVSDEVTMRVKEHVLAGMGAIFLHSAHMSKPFAALMGTSGCLHWKCGFVRERLWCLTPSHPIAKGIPSNFVLEQEEMYGEPFDIPKPDDLVFMAWYDDGHIFRSGCTYNRGNGKVFYFQPGHEEYPIYYNDTIRSIIKNAVNWAMPAIRTEKIDCFMVTDELV